MGQTVVYIALRRAVKIGQLNETYGSKTYVNLRGRLGSVPIVVGGPSSPLVTYTTSGAAQLRRAHCQRRQLGFLFCRFNEYLRLISCDPLIHCNHGETNRGRRDAHVAKPQLW